MLAKPRFFVFFSWYFVFSPVEVRGIHAVSQRPAGGDSRVWTLERVSVRTQSCSDKSPQPAAGPPEPGPRGAPVARVGSGKEQRAKGNWGLLQDTKAKE